jgi:hypothetical protein
MRPIDRRLPPEQKKVFAAGLGMEPSPRFNPGAKDAQDRSIATLEILSAAGADVNARITDVPRPANTRN